MRKYRYRHIICRTRHLINGNFNAQSYHNEILRPIAYHPFTVITSPSSRTMLHVQWGPWPAYSADVSPWYSWDAQLIVTYTCSISHQYPITLHQKHSTEFLKTLFSSIWKNHVMLLKENGRHTTYSGWIFVSQISSFSAYNIPWHCYIKAQKCFTKMMWMWDMCDIFM